MVRVLGVGGHVGREAVHSDLRSRETGPTGFDPQDDDIETAYNYRYDQLGNLVHDAAAHIDAIDWTVSGKVKAVTRTTGSPKSRKCSA